MNESTHLRASGQTLSDERLATLKALVAVMIPASDEFGVPGADDTKIFADIVSAAQHRVRELSDALQALDDLCRAQCALVFSALDTNAQLDMAQALDRTDHLSLELVRSITAQCYYRDDRVMHSLGMEPRAPFPGGHELEQGDWSLLDPVRCRRPFYRAAGSNRDDSA